MLSDVWAKIEMSSVIIETKKATLKGIVNKKFLETMFILNIIQRKCPTLLDYAEGVAKTGIGLMNVD